MAELIVLSDDSDREDVRPLKRFRRSLRGSAGGSAGPSRVDSETQKQCEVVLHSGIGQVPKTDTPATVETLATIETPARNEPLGTIETPARKNDTQAVLLPLFPETPAVLLPLSQLGVADIWACSACTFHNKLCARACEICNTKRDMSTSCAQSGLDLNIYVGKLESADSEGRMPLIMVSCSICNVEISLEMVYTLDNCSHKICRPCFQGYSAKLLDSMPTAHNAMCTDLFSHTVCPVQGCEITMSLEDLTTSVGSERVRAHQALLLSTMDGLFGSNDTQDPIVYKPCRVDGCGGRMISYRAIVQLDEAELKAALRAYGASTRGVRSTQLRNLTGHVKSELALVDPDDVMSPKREPGPGLEVCLQCRHVACSICFEPRGMHTPHCSLQEALSTFQLLERINQALIETPPRSAPKTKRKSAKNKEVDTENEADDMGMGVFGIPRGRRQKTVWAAGTGFGGPSGTSASAGVAVAHSVQAKTDSIIQVALEELTAILQQRRIFGLRIPVIICALLCGRPTLWRCLRQLAQNDSFMDIAGRRYLYLVLLTTLEEIKQHAELLPLLCCPPPAALDGAGSSSTSEETGTVIDALNNLNTQAKVAVQMAQEGTEDDDVALDIALACEVTSCYTGLVACVQTWRLANPEGPSTPPHNSPQDLVKGKGKKKLALGGDASAPRVTRSSALAALDEAPSQNLVDEYKKALHPHLFRQVSILDERGNYEHHFRSKLNGQSGLIDSNGVHNKKRVRRITTELPVLATSLPLEWASSIFFCMDDNRADVLKVMIIGPADTPYQNGMFFFDILLPPDYPNSPPLVQFLTTGGGKIRFNPNLYESGKVCLSLLGTWSGPGWDPKESTILQVLVSIQSLILVRAPYFNEPGRETMYAAHKPAADAYDSEQRYNTLQYAILPYLRKPPKHFADAIGIHLKFKCPEILQQCANWVDISLPAQKGRIKVTVEEIKAHFGAGPSSPSHASNPPGPNHAEGSSWADMEPNHVEGSSWANMEPNHVEGSSWADMEPSLAEGWTYVHESEEPEGP